VISEIKE